MSEAALAGTAQSVRFAGNSRRIVTDATLAPMRIPLPLVFSPAHTPAAVALGALLSDLARTGSPKPSREFMARRTGASVPTITRALRTLTAAAGGYRPMITTRRRCRRSAVRSVIRELHEVQLTVPRAAFDAIEAGDITAADWRMYLWLTEWRTPGTGQVLYTLAEMSARLKGHGITRTPAALSAMIAALVRAGLVKRYERPGRSPILRPLTVPTPKPSSDPSPPPSSDPSPPPSFDPSQGREEPLTGAEPLTDDQKLLVLPVGHAEVVARERRSGPAAPAPKPAPGAGAVIAALPAEITGQLRARHIPARITARVSAALATRTPAELAARIDRRWHAHGYAAAHDGGRITDPAAVISALIRPGPCPDVRCEDGAITDIGTGEDRACGMCAQDAPGRRNPPGPASTVPSPAAPTWRPSHAAPGPAGPDTGWRQPIRAVPKPEWADWRRHRPQRGHPQ